MRLSQNCLHCSLCQTRKKIVWGTGPHPAQLMLIGEAPGKAEDSKGEPFVGPSGRELTHLLWKLGIQREDVYITNLAKCRPKDDDDPTQEQIDECAVRYLVREIDMVQPRLIITLGRLSSRWLIGDPTMTMELMHGFLYRAGNAWVSPEQDVLPCYHPAAGLHQPNLLAQCQWDMAHIKPALAGALPYGPRVDHPYTGPLDYRIATTPREIDEVLAPDHTGVVAIDTEATEGGRPWCLTATTRPGSAVMIMAHAYPLTAYFTRLVEALDLTPVIHNALYDIPQLTEMGVVLPVARIQDTMTMAYHLQFIPKGLKPLAYRLAGVRMESYEETVRPARFAKTVEYLRRVADRTWDDPPQEIVYRPDGTPRIKRPQNVRAKAKRALLDVEKGRCEEPWDRWGKMEGTGQVEEVLGPMPSGWLSDLPIEVAKGYACQDSDVTRRIAPKLIAMCQERGLL